uniref:SAM-dependent methyltransferase n=1 Tax=Sciscionella sediminilitoris TaxID=1445613 RepID=UPI0018D0F974
MRDEPEIDSTTPNVARAYDYYLGGGANFKADRELAQQVLKVLPEARAVAVENRH